MKKVQILFALFCAVMLSACQPSVSVDVRAYWTIDGSGPNYATVAHIYDSVFFNHFTQEGNHSVSFKEQPSYGAKDEALKECAKIAEAIVDARKIEWFFAENYTVKLKRMNGKTYDDNGHNTADSDLIYEHTFGDTKVYEESDMAAFMASYSLYFYEDETNYIKSITLVYNDLATGKLDSVEVQPGKDKVVEKNVLGTNPQVAYFFHINLNDGVELPTEKVRCHIMHNVGIAVAYKNDAIQIVRYANDSEQTARIQSLNGKIISREYLIKWDEEHHCFSCI